MSKDDLPTATVVQDGKVPGDVPGGPSAPSGPRPKHKRRLSNYLLDKRLQLRYVLLVSILSAVISAILGYMIYNQMQLASEDVAAGLIALEDDETQRQIADELRERDRALILKMIAVGVGLVVILSAYLVIMTHKVAGPLYKVSMYFDQMTAGRLGRVTPLRKGDMLNDFYDGFRDMHGAVRGRLQKDVAAMQRLLDACEAAGVKDESVEALGKHVKQRTAALS